METTPTGQNTSRDSASRTRTGQGRWTKGRDSAARDARAVELRAEGRSYRQISDELGYGSHANVIRAVQRAVAAVSAPGVEAMRAEMDARLEHLYGKVTEVLNTKHLKVSGGQLVLVGPEGEETPLEDDAPILRSTETLLRLLDRRAKLHGLDAPVKIEAQVSTVTVKIEGADDV